MLFYVFIAFLVSFIFSITVTPLVRYTANRLNILDQPSSRKTHKFPIPRLGGIALFLGVSVGGLVALILAEKAKVSLELHNKNVYILLAGFLIFFIGIWDDIRGLKPKHKIIGQVIVSCLAIYGGVIISKVTVPVEPYTVELGYWGIPVTIIWYLLVLNGFNLIDGLDGLAAGVTFFASLLVLFGLLGGAQYLVCIFLATLIGSTLGFLRYNYYPATIFMGDCGSYFLGFMLATLTIMGSVKGQATVAILAPIVALGLPLFDTIFSAVRRFLVGKPMFKADRNHLHHKMLSLGLNHQKVVLIFYVVTICLGLVAIWIVQINDARISLLFLLISIAIFVGIKKLKYFDFLGPNRLVGWLDELYDDLGLHKERRAFRGTMMDLAESSSIEEMWKILIDVADFIGANYLSVRLASHEMGLWREVCVLSARDSAPIKKTNREVKGYVHVSFPIYTKEQYVGNLDLSVKINKKSMEKYFLRRLEQLQRTLLQCNVVCDDA